MRSEEAADVLLNDARLSPVARDAHKDARFAGASVYERQVVANTASKAAMMDLPDRRPRSNHSSRTGPEGNVERWVSGAKYTMVLITQIEGMRGFEHAPPRRPSVGPERRAENTIHERMAAHGHTAGQQVLVVNLPKMGRVMLSGDLYHFREEREQRVLPHSLEHDREKSRQSRVRLEAWATQNNVPIWIEHDTRLYATLKKAPAYLE